MPSASAVWSVNRASRNSLRLFCAIAVLNFLALRVIFLPRFSSRAQKADWELARDLLDRRKLHQVPGITRTKTSCTFRLLPRPVQMPQTLRPRSILRHFIGAAGRSYWNARPLKNRDKNVELSG